MVKFSGISMENLISKDFEKITCNKNLLPKISCGEKNFSFKNNGNEKFPNFLKTLNKKEKFFEVPNDQLNFTSNNKRVKNTYTTIKKKLSDKEGKNFSKNNTKEEKNINDIKKTKDENENREHVNPMKWHQLPDQDEMKRMNKVQLGPYLQVNLKKIFA